MGQYGQSVVIVDPATGNPVSVTGGQLSTDATLSGDVTLGAVELKDTATDVRVNVEALGGKNAQYIRGIELAQISGDSADIKTATEAIEVLNTDIKTAVELIDDAVATSGDTVPSKTIVVGQKAVSGVPEEVSNADMVYEWLDTYGRKVLYGANLSQGSLDVSPVSASPMPTQKVTGITQLTATGDTVEVNVEEYGVYGYALTVAALDTNVKVRLRGSIDEANYVTLPLLNTQVSGDTINNNEVTILQDGTYIIYTEAPVVDAKLDFFEETGGTAATIDADFFARRK